MSSRHSQQQLQCRKCGGTGLYHNSELQHQEKNCLFCTTCEVCDGKGTVLAPRSSRRESAAIVSVSSTNKPCTVCKGTGKVHVSPMTHSSPTCIFCTGCAACHGLGFVHEFTEKVEGPPSAVPRSLEGGSKNCTVCRGSGLVHNSLMTHRHPCAFCEPCPNCRGVYSTPPRESTPLIQPAGEDAAVAAAAAATGAGAGGSRPHASTDDEQSCCQCVLL